MRDYDYFNPLDFEKCIKDRKIILFGAGEVARQFINTYRDQYLIEAIIDSDVHKSGIKFEGFRIKSVDFLKTFPMESIVVLITCQHFYDIKDKITNLGIRYYFHYETMESVKDRKYKLTDITESEANELKKSSKYNFHYSWCSYNCYAHGFGMIDNIALTNSLEAFQRNYERGFRVFECDITKTKKQEFILCHGGKPFIHILSWRDGRYYVKEENVYNTFDERGIPYAIEKFKEEKIFGKYTPLSYSEALNLLLENSDAYLIPDLSHSNYNDLIDLAKTTKEVHPDLINRIIVEINVEDLHHLDDIISMGGYSSVMLIHDHNQYVYNRWADNQLLRICLLNGIKVLMLGTRRVSNHIITEAKKYGIWIGTYCWVNDKPIIERYQEMGVSIFCVEDYLIKGE